jgi:urease accessory protein
VTGAGADLGARQRTVAEARARFSRAGSRTEPSSLFETGGLRWRFPRSQSPCEAVLVNTGGGVAGGDSYRVALVLDAGAEVEATTPAAEKIYRSDGQSARIATSLSVGPGARMLWLPQETILFDGARLERTFAIDMAADANLIALETLVFGRLAMGETRIAAQLSDSWRLRRGGRLVFADATRIHQAGASLDRPACGAGARAVATLLAAAPDVEARLPSLRAALDAHGAEVEAGASAFDGLVVSRLISASPRRLREAAIAAILTLSGREPPRLWR